MAPIYHCVFIKSANIYGEIVAYDEINEQIAIDTPWGIRRLFADNSFVDTNRENVIAFREGYLAKVEHQNIFDALQRIELNKQTLLAFRRGYEYCK